MYESSRPEALITEVWKYRYALENSNLKRWYFAVNSVEDDDNQCQENAEGGDHSRHNAVPRVPTHVFELVRDQIEAALSVVGWPPA